MTGFSLSSTPSPTIWLPHASPSTSRLKKRSDKFNDSERANRNRGTVEPGVFAGRKREGFEGVPPRKRLWTGNKQRRLFT